MESALSKAHTKAREAMSTLDNDPTSTTQAKTSLNQLAKNETSKDQTSKEQKSYHTKATGQALQTVEKHSTDHDLKLYGSCFCPFVQRVWISLEHKGLDYQYIEVDPYAKPKSLLDVNPRGLVPALRHGDWGCYESTVLMEYLEDLNQGEPLLPSDPKARAHSRLWADHINRKIIPLFYRYLQEQDISKQGEQAAEFKKQIDVLVDAADPEGPFFLGNKLGFVDVQFAPWIVRMKKVLVPYRGWPEDDGKGRWGKWVHAVENDEHVKRTTSDDQLYLDSYERYAENRPNTSEVSKAINEGRGLP
ncbi:glutathione S-transferase [Microthyrium microscopicum]|uniref:Glutathione S-transferase n=1 Tax=Microthyrium microscopicum TaxID=703497 RepID=A0A6A6U8W3_9PEZI|nr:glutathione S-transferase [Microthyrium microscopicum]